MEVPAERTTEQLILGLHFLLDAYRGSPVTPRKHSDKSGGPEQYEQNRHSSAESKWPQQARAPLQQERHRELPEHHPYERAQPELRTHRDRNPQQGRIEAGHHVVRGNRIEHQGRHDETGRYHGVSHRNDRCHRSQNRGQAPVYIDDDRVAAHEDGQEKDHHGPAQPRWQESR